MSQDQVLVLFRQKAATMEEGLPLFNIVVLQLAQLLADSRERLLKENFDRLVYIGGILYKEGKMQFKAKSDLHPIMANPANDSSNG
jgi:hypothetical protein